MNDQEKINQFMQKCRDKGLSVTPQRLSIFKAMMNDNSHPNPETIYKRIKEDNPTISFATVYKALETFEQHGIIKMVTSLHNTVRYDPMLQQHHHIVCTKCKKVIDLVDEELNQIQIPESITKDNQFLDFSIQFNVICSECRAKQ